MAGVVLAGWSAAACVDQTGDVQEGAEASRATGERTAVVELMTTSRHTVAALQDERAAAGATIIGVEDARRLLVVDQAEARQSTDEAVARLESAVSDYPGPGGRYERALDTLRQLERLRSDVDAVPGPPSLAELDEAQEITSRYDQTVAGLLDANAGLADSVDNTDLRVGLDLHATALRQADLGARLTFTLLTDVIAGGGLDEAAEVDEVASLYGEALQGEAFVAERAADSEYEPAARALADDLDRIGYMDAVRAALETGTVELQQLLISADVPEDQGWLGLLDRVEATVAG